MEALMKIRYAFFTAAVMFFSFSLVAQDTQLKDPTESKELNTEAYIQLLRSDLKASKRTLIKESMQLEDKQAEVFWSLYNQYDVEQSKLADQKLALIQQYAAQFLSMNDQKADQLAHMAMDLEDQRLALRKKYYDLMKKSLPAVVVTRFFQIENQIQLLVDLQIASNLPIIEEAPHRE
jgi:hypothetical protein